MTRQEYEAKLTDLQSQIEELKQTEIEEDSPKPPHPRWKPGNDDIYYAVINTGIVTQHIWSKSSFDYERYDIGNVFNSFKEAEFVAERLRVLAEMREWAGKPNDPYQLVLDYNISEFIVNRTTCPHLISGEMRFATKDDAENCIKAVGSDRIKKYYFMVQDLEEI